jgi:hypothetical protein
VSGACSRTCNIKSGLLPHFHPSITGDPGGGGGAELRGGQLLPAGGHLRYFLFLPAVHNAAPAELPGDHDLHLHQHLLRLSILALLS